MSEHSFRLSKLVSHVAVTCEMKKWHYVEIPSSETFENYFGELIPVTIIEEETEAALKVLIKFAPLIHELRKCGVVHRVYCKEIYVYSTLKVEFESLTTNVTISRIMPKCYFVDATANEEVLILQDMRCKGFERYKNGLFMDIDHVKISLETLAQFHSLSFILQERNNEAFEVHKKVLKPFAVDNICEYRSFIKNAIKKLMMMFEGTNYQMDISHLETSFDNALFDEVAVANRMVYGHGDFWKENILFRYEEGKPKQACIVDYQQTRLMNPAYDVLFLLLNATDGSTRRKYFHEFLYSYLNTLQRVLRENDLNCQVVYTEKEFQEDLKSVAPICFGFVQSAFSLWLGLEENSILLSKHLCCNEKEKESKKNYYKKIIVDILDDLQFFGYL